MIESTDICHGCKNFEDPTKRNTCDACCHGKEDYFEPKEPNK